MFHATFWTTFVYDVIRTLIWRIAATAYEVCRANVQSINTHSDNTETASLGRSNPVISHSRATLLRSVQFYEYNTNITTDVIDEVMKEPVQTSLFASVTFGDS